MQTTVAVEPRAGLNVTVLNRDRRIEQLADEKMSTWSAGRQEGGLLPEQKTEAQSHPEGHKLVACKVAELDVVIEASSRTWKTEPMRSSIPLSKKARFLRTERSSSQSLTDASQPFVRSLVGLAFSSMPCR